VSKYHDEAAEGGRPHRVIVAVHPTVTTTSGAPDPDDPDTTDVDDNRTREF
jgi:hypothetical protein